MITTTHVAEKVVINGKYADTISVYDRGLHYGDGVFETIAFWHRQPILWHAHMARLRQGCHQLHLPNFSEKLLQHDIDLLKIDDQHAVIKVMLTRGTGGRGYTPAATTQCTRIVIVYPYPDWHYALAQQGIHVDFCHMRLSQNAYFSGSKHMNRLEQILASHEISQLGVDEGLLMDQQDNVIEGSKMNLFVVKNNQLLVPDLSACGVMGTMQAYIIKKAREWQMSVTITTISQQSLLQACELFMCNSVVGILPIKKLGRQDFQIGQVTRRFQQHLAEELFAQ